MLRRSVAIALMIAVHGFLPSPIQAQGVVGKCAQILLNYVGKPLAKGALSAAGGEVGRYLAERGLSTIRQGDVVALRQRGLSECEIRRQVEMLYAAQARPVHNRGYSAIARCSATGATGTAHNLASPGQAIHHAVRDCAYRGGIPACCEKGARLLP